ncbi:MAG TPA: ABC transporter permease [Anaerolineaceae bacterium]|nr:ABC transporter permease [Anaerolineaceae bacterium]
MQTVIDGTIEGLRLLFTGNQELWSIIFLSARVSGLALLISAVISIPLGSLLGLVYFRGKGIVQALVYTGMGLPPVVAGLAVYLLLSRKGILGPLNWPWVPELFTVEAMILAQVIIASPVVIGYTMAAVADVSQDLRVQLQSLGATRVQVTLAVLREARLGVIVALVGGFGSIISEVGAVTLVGGNIAGSTRVLTGAILLETREGNFDRAIGLGLVLLLLAFVINVGATRLQGKGR